MPVASLPAKQSRSVNVILAVGPGDDVAASVASILADPAGAVAAAQKEYARQVGEVFDRLPSLESSNRAIGAVVQPVAGALTDEPMGRAGVRAASILLDG